MPPKRPRTKKQDVDYQQGSDSDFEAAPPKKKATKAAGGKAKGKGKAKKKLELFTSAPLDVISLILSHLDASTLLAASRTCRVFRQLTHAPSGKSLWIAARANTPGQLPTLQATDFREWEYASLIFDRNCWGCQKGRAVTVDYTIRLRGCAACMRKLSLRQEKIYGSFHRLTFDCVPASMWNQMSFYFTRDVHRISRRLTEIEARSKKEGATAEEVAAFAEYVLERKQVVKAATQDARAIQKWEYRQKSAVADAGYQAAVNRRKKIEDKMRELGYTDEDLGSHAFTGHSLVNQQRDLTDRIWNTIRAPLIAVIEEDRVKRAAEKLSRRQVGRQKALLPFYESLIADDLARATFPPIADFIIFDSIRQLWESDDVVVDEAALEAARPLVVAEVEKFVRMFKIAVLSKLAKAHSDSKVIVDPQAPTTYHTAPNHSATDMEQLSTRITSAFHCPISSCHHFETFPSILAHAKKEHDWTYSAKGYSWPPHGSFNDSTLNTSANQINAIRLVLRAVNGDSTLPNVDEASTTTKELDDIGARFECVDCPGLEKAVAAAKAKALQWAHYETAPTLPTLSPMNWSELVVHSLKGHDLRSASYSPSATYTPPSIAILPPPPTPAVEADEEKAEVAASATADEKAQTTENQKGEGDVKMEAQDDGAAGASSAMKEEGKKDARG